MEILIWKIKKCNFQEKCCKNARKKEFNKPANFTDIVVRKLIYVFKATFIESLNKW